MGYTHYWYREKEIGKEKFGEIVQDFKDMSMLLHAHSVKLANGVGENEPVISEDEVVFNGVRNCGHPKHDVGIAWPDQSAKGVVSLCEVAGSWYAGATLKGRCCDGDCSHETFYFPRVLEGKEPVGKISHLDMNGQPVYNEPWKVGRYFDFTKTAFKPYDLAVNIFLVIAKHYLGSALIVTSDGELPQWQDAIELCQRFLGYGEDFALGCVEKPLMSR